ncbi:MAG: calcium/sodium antiporter [Gammaproteobacteria bacterium]|nr:calcium/sodium antiporter [Gammaproteobacteria bacterium]NNJ73108.1 calcium/sodium antiporter [Enterobacterales bacterium]
MLLNFALIFIGIALLVWSADRFTDGASAFARNLGVSPLIVGLTIVAIGSSAPEIFVSVSASLSGSSGLAVGNAIGSNIANIALVLGVTALIVPLQIESNVLRREFPVMFLVTFLAGFLLWDGYLSFIDGAVLIFCMFLYLFWMVHTAIKNHSNDRMLVELVGELPDDMTNKRAALWIVVGLILLPLSSQILVNGATGIAMHFGVSEFVIGLTIVALGTSLPELAASVASVLKGEHELAIGNVIGSNIFNLLAVLGVAGVITPVAIDIDNIVREYSLMVFLTVVMFFMAYGFRGPARISRIEGGILTIIYAVFLFNQ